MKRIVLLSGMAVLAGAIVLTLVAAASDDDPVNEAVIDQPIPNADFDGPFQGPQDEKSWEPFCRLEALKEELGLTQEQLDKLESLRVDHEKQMIDLGAKLKVASVEMEQLMMDRGNDDAVRAKSAEITSLMTKIGELRVNHQLARRAVFTGEQWSKIKSMRTFGRRHMMGRGDRGTGHGYGMRPHRGMRPGQGMGLGPWRNMK
jgi:Spy/CpxP family protein refolding chaperone